MLHWCYRRNNASIDWSSVNVHWSELFSECRNPKIFPHQHKINFSRWERGSRCLFSDFFSWRHQIAEEYVGSNTLQDFFYFPLFILYFHLPTLNYRFPCSIFLSKSLSFSEILESFSHFNAAASYWIYCLRFDYWRRNEHFNVSMSFSCKLIQTKALILLLFLNPFSSEWKEKRRDERERGRRGGKLLLWLCACPKIYCFRETPDERENLILGLVECCAIRTARNQKQLMLEHDESEWDEVILCCKQANVSPLTSHSFTSDW